MTDDEEPEAVIIREADDDVVSRPGASEEIEREEAFNAVYEWNGKTFEGPSASRMDLWRSMCHKAEFPPLDKCYDESDLFIPRAKVMIFVCVTSTKHLRALRAKGIGALVEAYEDWADAEVPTYQETKALTLGLKIFNQSHLNRAEVVPSGSSSLGK